MRIIDIVVAFGVLLSLAVNLNVAIPTAYSDLLRDPWVRGVLLYGAAYSVTKGIRSATAVLLIHYALMHIAAPKERTSVEARLDEKPRTPPVARRRTRLAEKRPLTPASSRV